VLAAGFALEIVALRTERAPVAPTDPWAPEQSASTAASPTAVGARSAAIPVIVPRREPPITVEVDESLWRR
jgi:hypothetical protein